MDEYSSVPLKEKILSSIEINSNGCWIWKKCKNTWGYAQITVKQKAYGVHRLAYELFTGNKIPKGKMACHTCDVKDCVNPKHIYIGTAIDNARDAKDRGLLKSGLQNPNTKVTKRMAIEIIREYKKAKLTMLEIAKRNGVSLRTVAQVIDGKSWVSPQVEVYRAELDIKSIRSKYRSEMNKRNNRVESLLRWAREHRSKA